MWNTTTNKLTINFGLSHMARPYSLPVSVLHTYGLVSPSETLGSKDPDFHEFILKYFPVHVMSKRGTTCGTSSDMDNRHARKPHRGHHLKGGPRMRKQSFQNLKSPLNSVQKWSEKVLKLTCSSPPTSFCFGQECLCYAKLWPTCHARGNNEVLLSRGKTYWGVSLYCVYFWRLNSKKDIFILGFIPQRVKKLKPISFKGHHSRIFKS